MAVCSGLDGRLPRGGYALALAGPQRIPDVRRVCDGYSLVRRAVPGDTPHSAPAVQDSACGVRVPDVRARAAAEVAEPTICPAVCDYGSVLLLDAESDVDKTLADDRTGWVLRLGRDKK